MVALHLGGEIYGVDIASIHTVLTPQPITAIPNVPPYVRGVMNLRGRIVIVEAEGMTAGLIVDAVSEVLKLTADAIESPSVLLGSSDLRCLTGIDRVPGGKSESDGKKDASRLILLLDIVETLKSVAAGDTATLAA